MRRLCQAEGAGCCRFADSRSRAQTCSDCSRDSWREFRSSTPHVIARYSINYILMSYYQVPTPRTALLGAVLMHLAPALGECRDIPLPSTARLHSHPASCLERSSGSVVPCLCSCCWSGCHPGFPVVMVSLSSVFLHFLVPLLSLVFTTNYLRRPEKMLTVVVLVMLASSWSEGLVLSKCELRSQLQEAFPELHSVNHKDILTQFVCTVEHNSWFNTSFVSIDYVNPELLIRTLTIFGLGEKDLSAMKKNLLPEEMLGSGDNSGEGSSDIFSGSGSGENSGEGSGDIFSGSGSGDNSGEGSGDIFSGSGSGDNSGEGSGDIFSGSGSGDNSGEGSGDIFSGSGSGDNSGEGSGDIFSGSGSGDNSGEGSGDIFSGSGSGDNSGEGSGDIFSGSGSGENSGEGSGDIFSGSGSGDNSGEGSGDIFSDRKREKRAIHKEETNELQYILLNPEDMQADSSGQQQDDSLLRMLSESGSSDYYGESLGDDFSGSSSENWQRKKRAIHKEEHVGDQMEMDEDGVISRTLYGIFQLSDDIACKSGSIYSLNRCQLDCAALTDDDITDDIACLKILNEM
ncbi:hypothetical protein P4O66_021574, partial [Electrophorus voltai]